MREAVSVQLPRTGRVREWHCIQCGTVLAWFDASGFRLHEAVTRLDGEIDGMPRYGLPREGRSRRRDPEPSRRGLPIFVYCPACRAGQRLAA